MTAHKTTAKATTRRQGFRVLLKRKITFEVQLLVGRR